MLKLKKLISILVLFFTVALYSYSENVTMKIILESGDYSVTIYQGKVKKSIEDLLRKAKKIRFGGIEKAVVVEGEYHIEIISGSNTVKYTVQNNFWVYDEVGKKYLRCGILNELREIFISYLFEHGAMDFLEK